MKLNNFFKHIIHQGMYIVTCFVLLCACGDSQKKTSQKVNIQSKEFQDKLIDVNKMYVKQESDEIDQYVRHRNWQMTTTGTGLRYMITKKGEGEKAVPDKFVRVNYKVSLLDGTVCYSSDSTGARDFLVGQDNVESGLHEAIQLMNVGGKAIFILPSHLAHGLIGDENKIPAKSSVIYDIELLAVH
jgi:FKBP-type peptidyl-prolyl cis-trans isomerase FkpA